MLLWPLRRQMKTTMWLSAASPPTKRPVARVYNAAWVFCCKCSECGKLTHTHTDTHTRTLGMFLYFNEVGVQ